jgi:signal transduction histidine kinase
MSGTRHGWRALGLILLAMVAALAAAVAFVALMLDPPPADLRLLVLFMSGSGGATVLATYVLYRQSLIRGFSSLRWALLANVAMIVVVVLLNVWFTAQLMFISQHDLVLTIALLVFAGLTALAFGIFVAGTLTDRIRALAGAADRLAEGKLDTRLDVTGSDELADLAHSFNWMADSLQRTDEQKRQIESARRALIAGISHDLRTPLTSLRAMIEAIADGVVDDPATVTRYVNTSLAELQHLNTLIDDLFELARLDAGQVDMQICPASMTDLISDVISSMSARAAQRDVALVGTVETDIDPIEMAPDKIQRVLVNLLDNALRYTPPGGQIAIRARRDGSAVRVDVHNTGSSIDAAHLPHVFTTFYRGEPSRVRGDDGHRGTGLGLAIARGFVEAHHGRIWADSTPLRGTTFSFTLPVQAAA